jgi:glycosyltransferase involved in cell wall biosynthesis
VNLRRIDIIITTYNRAEKVRRLVQQLLDLRDNNIDIIIVDSSEESHSNSYNNTEVKYLFSSHQNQPYQRFLGYQASKAEILVFLDDDMELLDNEFHKKILNVFEDDSIKGIAIKFTDKNEITSLSKLPTSKIFINNRLKSIKNWLTGTPALGTGKYGLCGNKGRQPEGGGNTEWVSGGAFAARREALFKNFNFQLFDIFEDHLGMGEDGIIGYGISRIGRVAYYDELFFLHDDQGNSAYSTKLLSFARRVAFSRKYLSIEKKRLDSGWIWAGKVHYHYYMFWRIMGYFANTLFGKEDKWREILRGSLEGWERTFSYKFNKPAKAEKFWRSEAWQDLKRQII